MPRTGNIDLSATQKLDLWTRLKNGELFVDIGPVLGKRAAAAITLGIHALPSLRDGAAAAEAWDQAWRQAAPGAADQDAGSVLTVTAVGVVDDGKVGALI